MMQLLQVTGNQPSSVSGAVGCHEGCVGVRLGPVLREPEVSYSEVREGKEAAVGTL